MKEVTAKRLEKLIHWFATTNGLIRLQEVAGPHAGPNNSFIVGCKRRAMWAALHNEMYHRSDNRNRQKRHKTQPKHRWTQ